MVAAMGTTQHLGEGAVQRAELALQGSVIGLLRGMRLVLEMRMPRGVRQCCLLREQQE